MADISDNVKELIRRRVPSMDHIEVLMRLHEAPDAAHTPRDLERTTRLGAETVDRSLAALVAGHLAQRDAAAEAYRYAPGSPADRTAVDELASLYNQRPVTLVKLIYAQPPTSVRSFADAFRLRESGEEDA